MASMRELYPLKSQKSKVSRNFIFENIRSVKAKKLECSKHITCMNNLRRCKSEKDVASNSQQKRNNDTKKCFENIRTAYSAPTQPARTLISQSCQTDNFGNSNVQNAENTCYACGRSAFVNKSCQTEDDRNDAGDALNTLPNHSSDQKLEECVSEQMVGSKHNVIRSTTHEKCLLPNDNVAFVPSSYQKGVVPKYLIHRNAQVEQERSNTKKRDKIIEELGLNDPECPPGHMLMPAEEKRQLLKNLDNEYKTLVKQLNNLPVSSDSYRISQRKIYIEKQLKCVEEAIDHLKRKKIFVEAHSLDAV